MILPIQNKNNHKNYDTVINLLHATVRKRSSAAAWSSQKMRSRCTIFLNIKNKTKICSMQPIGKKCNVNTWFLGGFLSCTWWKYILFVDINARTSTVILVKFWHKYSRFQALVTLRPWIWIRFWTQTSNSYHASSRLLYSVRCKNRDGHCHRRSVIYVALLVIF